MEAAGEGKLGKPACTHVHALLVYMTQHGLSLDTEPAGKPLWFYCESCKHRWQAVIERTEATVQ